MALRPILLAATAVLFMAGGAHAAAVIDELLNEKTAAEVEQLTKDPEKNRARLNAIGAITQSFAKWQNDYQSDSAGTRDRYSKMKVKDTSAMFEKFSSVIKEGAVSQLKNDLESTGSGGWQDTLNDFWKCYFYPDTCTVPA